MMRDRPGPYTWRSAELNASVTCDAKYYAERKGRNVLADKTEALVELLRATPYDAVVLGFPLLGDVCNEKAAGSSTHGTRARAAAQRGLLAALQPRASYIWRSTPLFNEWHMPTCLATPLVLAANAQQARTATPPRSPATRSSTPPSLLRSICCGVRSRGGTSTPT